MKVSEILVYLTNRPQEAELLVAEVPNGLAPTHVLSVESINPADSPNAVFLMAQTKTRPSFELRPVGVQATIRKSDEGKFQILIGGVPLFSPLDTEKGAAMFVRGNVMGLGVKRPEKGLDAAS